MAISRQKKEDIVGTLKDVLSAISSAVFVNFHGLSVSDTSNLRKKLKSENILYTVAKKTLLKRALKETSVKGDLPDLTGEIAIVYPSKADVSDMTAAAREVYEFQKKYDGRLSIVGGIFEGGYKDKEGMLEIATIPSQFVLRGMFVNLINSPIQRFVIALDQIAQKK